jgi:hypothetical protein
MLVERFRCLAGIDIGAWNGAQTPRSPLKRCVAKQVGAIQPVVPRRRQRRGKGAQFCVEIVVIRYRSGRRIERVRLERELAAMPPAQPTRLVMDEFALFKGHRYATVVLDADTRRVLWVGEGRSREAIRPFFEWLGPERCARIEAVAMDMNTAFDLDAIAQPGKRP